METKELRLRQKGEVEVPVLESLEYYEDFIDNAYFERFWTLNPSVEAPSTSREYEEWIDKKFEETSTHQLRWICVKMMNQFRERIQWSD